MCFLVRSFKTMQLKVNLDPCLPHEVPGASLLKPGEARCPSPAEVVHVREDESYATVPGFDPALGAVYDQDTNNLRAQQQGFRAARKKGQTLGNYQEVRIRHFQRTLDRYLAEALPGRAAGGD
jgi:hypothetical protein